MEKNVEGRVKRKTKRMYRDTETKKSGLAVAFPTGTNGSQLHVVNTSSQEKESNIQVYVKIQS